MPKETLLELLKVGAPIIIAIVTTAGGATGLFYWLLNRPKTAADVKKVNAEVGVTIAEEWQKLYTETNNRMKAMEDKYDARVKAFELQLEEKDKAHAQALRDKDKTIREQNTKIDTLTRRVDELTRELNKYKNSTR